MMDIHPHWQSTGDAVAPAAGQGLHVPVGHSSGSRRPAALVGIALVFALGFAAIQGIPSFSLSLPGSSLSGKVSESLPSSPSGAAEIHITDRGLVPASITVRPGQEITWFNDQATIPHILESETLRGTDGALLYTPAVFPGSSTTFTVAKNLEPGTYPYASTTSDAVVGTVVVVADAGTPLAPTGVHSTIPAVSTQSTDDAQAISATAQSTADALPTPPQNQDALLPHNPYMIGSARAHPFDVRGNPVETIAQSKTRQHASAPRQPETGASLWIALLLSLGAFLWTARRFVWVRH